MTSGKRHSQRLQETTPVNVSAIAGIDFQMLVGSSANIVGGSMRNVALKKTGALMESIKDELVLEKIHQCPTCGSPVTVKGLTTKFYVPIDAEILRDIGFKNENWFNDEK